MTRSVLDRLDDILAASAAINEHLGRGPLSDSLVLDAVKLQLISLGEAVKGLPTELTAVEPDIEWDGAAGMKDWLTHHYFNVDTETLENTLANDLPPLVDAVRRLRDRVAASEAQ